MAALRHFRRPDFTVEGEDVTIYSAREREPIPLAMLHHPLCVTFSYYESGEVVIMDATSAEEQVREGEVIISMNRHGEVCQIAKYGGNAIDPLIILNCTNLALVQVKETSKLIQVALDVDAREKDVGGLIAELSAENSR